MRKVALLLTLLACSLFSGCSSLSPEDREFYYRHWVRPSSADDPQDRVEDAEFSRKFWRGN